MLAHLAHCLYELLLRAMKLRLDAVGDAPCALEIGVDEELGAHCEATIHGAAAVTLTAPHVGGCCTADHAAPERARGARAGELDGSRGLAVHGLTLHEALTKRLRGFVRLLVGHLSRYVIIAQYFFFRLLLLGPGDVTPQYFRGFLFT